MSHIVAITNQKGGVGKTTSAISIASDLALAGSRVLLVDIDPQCNATSGLGVQPNPDRGDLYDVFMGRESLSKIIVPSPVERLFVVPASKDLIGLEVELGRTSGRELILRSELRGVAGSFDFVFIDCPPSSGLLSLNALGAAGHLLIPLQAEYYALEGLSALMNTVTFVRETFNPEIQILGVFLTMFDGRTNLSAQVESEIRDHFGEKLFATRIPRNVKLSECPSHGLPIALYDPASTGARAYRELAREVANRLAGQGGGQMVANS